MQDILIQTLTLPGLWVVLGAVALAGLVYGFAGFGAALIFTPIAVAVIPPEMAIAAFSLSALVSLFTVLPSAAKEADLRASAIMIGAAIIATPLGVYALRVAEADVVRIIVASIVLMTLAALMFGWRLQSQPSVSGRVGIGAAAGAMGGMTGLNGPVVILFQLAGQDGARVSRANLIIFLTITSISFLPQLWLQGLLSLHALVLGGVMMPVYAVTTWLGKRLFTPERESLYRRIAYLIIGLAGVMALPIWE